MIVCFSANSQVQLSTDNIFQNELAAAYSDPNANGYNWSRLRTVHFAYSQCHNLLLLRTATTIGHCTVHNNMHLRTYCNAIIAICHVACTQ